MSDRHLVARGSAWNRIGVLMLTLALGLGTPVIAQDPAPAAPAPAAPAATPAAAPAAETSSAPATKEGAKSGLAWFAESEGVFLWPQLALGVAVISMVGVGVVFSLKSRYIDEGFVAGFEGLVKNRQFKEAFELAKTNDTFLGRILSAGMARLTDGHADALVAMQEAGASENLKTESRLSILAMLGNIATLVGLLGTVYGMVGSFMVLAQSDVSPSPSALAKGVSQALVTTIVGLVESIPAIMAFTILTNLNNRRLTDVGMMADQLMRPFKQISAARKPAAPASPPASPSVPPPGAPAAPAG